MISQKQKVRDTSTIYNRGKCPIERRQSIVLTIFPSILVLVFIFAVHDTRATAETNNSITEQCMELAENGSTEICSKCPNTSNNIKTNDAKATKSKTKKKTIDMRLPKSVIPLHYDLELLPLFFADDPKDFTFEGYVSIHIICENATDTISIHAKDLVVDSEDIYFCGVNSNTRFPEYVGMSVDNARQFIIFKLSDNLTVGEEYRISMSFSGVLKGPSSKSLFYSSYSRGNDTVYLVASKFQPTSTRRAFPCFDEPAMKATFTITLVRPHHLISLSNMPIRDSNTTLQRNRMTFVKDVYYRTPIMSSYLLAFVVGNFTHLSNYTSRNVLGYGIRSAHLKERMLRNSDLTLDKAITLGRAEEKAKQQLAEMRETKVEGVETDIDDILVWGKNTKEPDERLRKVLNRCRKINLTLNEKKCHFNKEEITYLGHKLTQDGVQPDKEKVKAITAMPPPEDKKGVERLLGTVNYMAKFIPNLSTISEPIRKLLKKDNQFVWEHEQAKAFEEIKNAMTSEKNIRLF
ncbi:polyprotein [Plakobranchus ocellatus]|uniref:Polyprotein n=1 Tax=Plakobranchus ocellatus TaxID=259542 RepID=A0AAV3XUM0_9GAST|nr:polyprotein [Plakobranchus ocellatus]